VGPACSRRTRFPTGPADLKGRLRARMPTPQCGELLTQDTCAQVGSRSWRLSSVSWLAEEAAGKTGRPTKKNGRITLSRSSRFQRPLHRDAHQLAAGPHSRFIE
jgi:hypothetical protein